MKTVRPKVPAQPDPPTLRLFAALFGAFLGLAFLKFSNPPIMEKYVAAPGSIWEFLLGYPWPITWAYGLLAVVAVLGLTQARWNPNVPKWVLALPLAWLVWQVVAASHTLDLALTNPTLAHFVACTVCFYLAVFSLSRLNRAAWFWLGLLCAFMIVLAVGWEQHFGGLEETRRYFYLYEYKPDKPPPPEYLKRLSSNRIFATLFYPNALAGALLLLLPPILTLIGQARKLLTPGARGFSMAAVGAAALACLYWSGSKGGWLVMLLLGLLVLLRLPFAKSLKLALVAAVLLAGVAGFFWKYSSFFRKGATSVVARFDYWQAALRTAEAHPLFGTGPGTFKIPYAKIKRPESEMARLVHNDYLEQASDSGLPGCLTYTAFVVGVLAVGTMRPRTAPVGEAKAKPDAGGAGERSLEPYLQSWGSFALWLGVLGWAVQGLFEFSLYVPVLGWAAFAFMGLLVGRGNCLK